MRRLLVFLWIVVKPAVPWIAGMTSAISVAAFNCLVIHPATKAIPKQSEWWMPIICWYVFSSILSGPAAHFATVWLCDEMPGEVRKKWQEAVEVTKRPDEVSEMDTLLRPTEPAQ